ncbi:MAG: hypothetical protein AAF802_22080 [Planctomycetota bacterium]
MNKILTVATFALAFLCIIGCGPGEPTSVVEGVEMSEIEAYNKALEESQASMQEGADAAKKAGVKNY